MISVVSLVYSLFDVDLAIRGITVYHKLSNAAVVGFGISVDCISRWMLFMRGCGRW